jgi:sugar transferase (PEP-CTERM/EpsH1 system associated)
MGDILFLSHRVPFPPDKGDKIRSWHILHRLAQHHRVHLGCLIDDKADLAHIPMLRKLCASCGFAELNRLGALARSIGALAKNEPLTFAHFRQAELIKWVAATHRRHHIDAQFIFSSVMALYAEAVPDFRGIRIVDFVDVDSDKWTQYARSRPWPLSWIYNREARLLADVERRIAEDAQFALFVSEDEAAFFRRGASSHTTVLAMPNGVDTVYFDPERDYPSPYPPDNLSIALIGRMDYWANVDAAIWFSREILPMVWRSVPDVRFYIVGAEPTQRVQALAYSNRIIVTGRVSDVRPYLAHATLAVTPLRIARGIQNKVLEAMAMGKAVVATPQAFEGIEANPGHDIVVADSATTFAAAVAGLLRDVDARRRIGARARELMISKYRWDSRLKVLDRLVELIDQDGAPRYAAGG